MNKIKSVFCIFVLLIFVSGLLTGCKASEVDKACMDRLAGSYEMCDSTEKDAYMGMAMVINYEDNKTSKPHFSIYDTCGNPGVEGKILKMDESTITVKIDQEYYEGMPAGDWKEKNGELILSYNIEEKEGRNKDGIDIIQQKVILSEAFEEKETTKITFIKELQDEEGEIISNELVEIDEDALAQLTGTYHNDEYDATLTIVGKDKVHIDPWEEDCCYFFTIDRGDENIVNGNFVKVDDQKLEIYYNGLSFEFAPGIELQETGNTISYTYQKESDGIIVTNNKNSIKFIK